MECTRYIVTETTRFADMDRQYLNSDKNTVCGIYRTKDEAFQRARDIAHSPLFYGCHDDSIKETEDSVIIDVPDYVHSEFHIFEHHFS